MCISTQRNSKNAHMNSLTSLEDYLRENQTPRKKEKNSVRKYDHLMVQHSYHDHSNDVSPRLESSINEAAIRGGVAAPFPQKLFVMLSQVERDEQASIVSWQPHGRSFTVHKPKEFVALLPHFFKLSKLASFQRQLNLYGFMRLTRGPDKGGYYHECFLRGHPWLLHQISRVKVKGTGVRGKSNPDQEPNFWKMPFVTFGDSAPVVGDFDTHPDLFVEMDADELAREALGEANDEDSMSTTESTTSSDSSELKMPQYVPSRPVPSQERSNDTCLEWGKPFHYIEHLNLTGTQGVHPMPMRSSSLIETNELDDLDFDDLVRELCEDKEGWTFADLLDETIASL